MVKFPQAIKTNSETQERNHEHDQLEVYNQCWLVPANQSCDFLTTEIDSSSFTFQISGT